MDAFQCLNRNNSFFFSYSMLLLNDHNTWWLHRNGQDLVWIRTIPLVVLYQSIILRARALLAIKKFVGHINSSRPSTPSTRMYSLESSLLSPYRDILHTSSWCYIWRSFQHQHDASVVNVCDVAWKVTHGTSFPSFYHQQLTARRSRLPPYHHVVWHLNTNTLSYRATIWLISPCNGAVKCRCLWFFLG